MISYEVTRNVYVKRKQKSDWIWNEFLIRKSGFCFGELSLDQSKILQKKDFTLNERKSITERIFFTNARKEETQEHMILSFMPLR